MGTATSRVRRAGDLHTCTQAGGGARLGWGDGADAQALVRGTWHVGGGTIVAPLHAPNRCVSEASDAGNRTGSGLGNGAAGGPARWSLVNAPASWRRRGVAALGPTVGGAGSRGVRGDVVVVERN